MSSPDPFYDLGKPIGQLEDTAYSDHGFSIEQLPDIWDLDSRTTWLVDQLIPEGAVTLISGDSGVGKSTFVLALAGAVVHGAEFLGRTTMQREVLILDRENPLATQRQRLNRLGIARTRSLRIWGGWVRHMATPGPIAPILLDYARTRALMIFDSLVAFHPGSEQDSSDTRRFMDGFRLLASLGATVIVIHHSGKGESSKDYRGSSDIKASVDTAYHVGGTDTGQLQSITLKPFKQREGNVSEIRIEYRDGAFYSSGRTNTEIVRDIVRQSPGLNATEVVTRAREAGVSKHRAEELLSEGQKNGWLKVDPAGRNAKRCYLADPGEGGITSLPELPP